MVSRCTLRCRISDLTKLGDRVVGGLDNQFGSSKYCVGVGTRCRLPAQSADQDSIVFPGPTGYQTSAAVWFKCDRKYGRVFQFSNPHGGRTLQLLQQERTLTTFRYCYVSHRRTIRKPCKLLDPLLIIGKLI